MATITVRNLDPDTRDRLKLQASAHGRSMESEARAILTAAVTTPAGREGGLGSRISALFADVDGDGVPVERRDDAAPVVSFTP